ncbi:hypothetical protein PIB30_048086 [Stylosanthes scabra]|uniref:Uncharacterized protein n=1 Tax=Stylosanthes scabra TaxID=79078 RepID=A0ABU6WKA9_9FABA|nr:hypothetical protein [Stylosanthes scabra]
MACRTVAGYYERNEEEGPVMVKIGIITKILASVDSWISFPFFGFLVEGDSSGCSGGGVPAKDEDDEGHGLIASPQKTVYSLTAASKYFVADDYGFSFGHALNLILDKINLETW